MTPVPVPSRSRLGCIVLATSVLASSASAAPPGPEARPALARANRLAINLGFGFGSADLSQLHRGVDDLGFAAEQQFGVKQQGGKSGIQINAEIAFRYYFPYYMLAQVGCDAVYNWASASYGSVNILSNNNDNLALEVPILVGGYYPFFGRLYVFGAAGPTVVVFPRVFWDPGGIDLKGDTTVGAQVLVGADFVLAEHVSLGLELRYRYLRTGELKEKNSGVVVTSGLIRGDGSTDTYNLDLSGVSLGFNLRFYIL